MRMSMLGLQEVGIFDPKGRDRENIIVFVEMDRCATDAVQSVTGCSLGHRTMKFMDYGKMAVTFVNVATGVAQSGTPGEVFTNPASKEVEELINTRARLLGSLEAVPGILKS